MKGISIYLISYVITGGNCNYFKLSRSLSTSVDINFCFVKFLSQDYFENLKIQKQHCFEIIWYACNFVSEFVSVWKSL